MLNVQPSNLAIWAAAKIAWGWICWTVKTFCSVVKEELTWFSSDWADVPGLRFRVTDISLCRFRDAEWYIAIVAFQIFVTAFSYATKFGWTSASRSRPTLVFLTERLETFFLFMYTCQLFLRCRREIFILGVLWFLKTTRSFPKIPEEVRSLPKTSEVCRRRSYRARWAASSKISVP